MKVILTKDVPNVGRAGQIKDVADGFGRNFLIPKGFAVAATKQTLKDYNAQETTSKRRHEKEDQANRVLAEEIAKTELSFAVKVGEQHRLYGSITNADIAEALSRKLKREFDKHHVALEEPLKHLGTFKVPIHLAPGLAPEVTVTLAKEE